MALVGEAAADCDVEQGGSGAGQHQAGGDLAAALGRITPETFVMPIDEDLLFLPRDCIPEQEMIKGSELRVVNDVLGHLGLLGVAPPSCRRSTSTCATYSPFTSEP